MTLGSTWKKTIRKESVLPESTITATHIENSECCSTQPVRYLSGVSLKIGSGRQTDRKRTLVACHFSNREGSYYFGQGASAATFDRNLCASMKSKPCIRMVADCLQVVKAPHAQMRDLAASPTRGAKLKTNSEQFVHTGTRSGR